MILATLAAGTAMAAPFQTPVFISGQDGYNTFRIPSLTQAADGTIIAICEGRRASSSDTGNIDLVMKTSKDKGRTWSDLAVIWDDGPNTCGNPCVVVDPSDGVIHLLSTHNLGRDHESRIISRDSIGTRTIWHLSSADNGRTWSKPKHITKTVKKLDWTWYATGPGKGIATSSGRLIIPCDHIEADTNKYFSHVIYSDDHGQTWKLGGSTPTDQVNECEVVQLSDGRLMLNMRNYDRTKRARAISYSDDEGKTWGPVTRTTQLPESICQASTVRWDAETIAFSNPASTTARVNMQVKISINDGADWKVFSTLHEGPSAYSSLSVLDGGRLGCLYERGEKNPYETITFAELLR